MIEKDLIPVLEKWGYDQRAEVPAAALAHYLAMCLDTFLSIKRVSDDLHAGVRTLTDEEERIARSSS